jgi:diguanylate cyclase (GGDEF)-like protein/PAS domain S-box-containing protein
VKGRDVWVGLVFEKVAMPLALLDESQSMVKVNAAFGRLMGQAPDELIGRVLTEFEVRGPDQKPADLADAPERFERRYRHADGTVALHEVRVCLLDAGSAGRLLLSQHRDVTANRAADADAGAQRTLAEQRERQQRAVAELGSFALVAETFVEVLDQACAAMARLLRCPSVVALELLPGSEHDLLLRAGVGLPPGMPISEAWYVRAGGITHTAVGQHRTVVLNDALDPSEPFAPAAIMRQEGLRSAVAVPVPDGPGVWGVISAASHSPRAFAATERDFVTSVSNVLAAAVARFSAEQRIQYQAWHDPLTGLPNRLLLDDRLRHALQRARRSRGDVAVILADLDSFKDVNDTHGHAGGDRLLREVARRLRQAVRPQDTVARLGGDEFLIVCEDIDGAMGAVSVADRARAACAEPFLFENHEIFVRASVGISVSERNARSEATSLLRDADTAMYRAKRTGGNRVEVFDERLRIEAHERMARAAELRRAILEDQLTVHYQPIVSLDSQRTVGVEALVRWDHPKLGLLDADAVIPTAEQNNLVDQVGSFVRRTSIPRVGEWLEALNRAGGALNPVLPPLYLAINVSPSEFARPGFPADLLAEINATGLPEGWLAIEVTEGALLPDLPAAREALNLLRRAGCRTLLDDFGTGYSSLRYLRDLPFTGVKVDRSFVAGLPHDVADMAVVRAVLTLANDLGLDVVAEGVETAEQAATLRNLGCRYAQGFLWDKALPPADIRGLLERGEYV